MCSDPRRTVRFVPGTVRKVLTHTEGPTEISPKKTKMRPPQPLNSLVEKRLYRRLPVPHLHVDFRKFSHRTVILQLLIRNCDLV